MQLDRCPLMTVDTIVDAERGRLLTRFETRPRINLTREASALLDKALKISGMRCPQDPPGAISVFNRSALIESYRGHLNTAQAVCVSGMELSRRMGLETSDVNWLSQMVQPYINIGRLYLLQGQWLRACGVFRALYELYYAGRPLEISGHLFTKVLADSTCRCDPVLPLVVKNAYVFDSVRGMLLAREYREILEFIDRIVQEDVVLSEEDQLPLLESRCRAFLGLGDIGAAFDAGKEMLSAARRRNVPIVGPLCLIADIYRLSGSDRDAARIMKAAAEHLRPIRLASLEASHAKAMITYRLAVAQLCAKEYEEAAAHAWQAYELCVESSDEPCSLRVLSLLIHLRLLTDRGVPHNSHVSHRHVEALEELADRSEFRAEKIDAYLQLADFFYESDGGGMRQARLDLLDRCLREAAELETPRGREVEKALVDVQCDFVPKDIALQDHKGDVFDRLRVTLLSFAHTDLRGEYAAV